MTTRLSLLTATALLTVLALAPAASAHLNVLGPDCQDRLHLPGPHGVAGPYYCYPVRHADHGDDEIVHAGPDDPETPDLIDHCHDQDPFGGLTDPVDRIIFEICDRL